jgi:hypothetical protein
MLNTGPYFFRIELALPFSGVVHGIILVTGSQEVTFRIKHHCFAPGCADIKTHQTHARIVARLKEEAKQKMEARANMVHTFSCLLL